MDFRPNSKVTLRGGRIGESLRRQHALPWDDDVRFNGFSQTLALPLGENALGFTSLELRAGEYILSNPAVYILPASSPYVAAGYQTGQKVRGANLFHPGAVLRGNLGSHWSQQISAVWNCIGIRIRSSLPPPPRFPRPGEQNDRAGSLRPADWDGQRHDHPGRRHVHRPEFPHLAPGLPPRAEGAEDRRQRNARMVRLPGVAQPRCPGCGMPSWPRRTSATWPSSATCGPSTSSRSRTPTP